MEPGVQGIYKYLKMLDSGFRRNDGKVYFKAFPKIINFEGASCQYGENYD